MRPLWWHRNILVYHLILTTACLRLSFCVGNRMVAPKKQNAWTEFQYSHQIYVYLKDLTVLWYHVQEVGREVRQSTRAGVPRSSNKVREVMQFHDTKWIQVYFYKGCLVCERGIIQKVFHVKELFSDTINKISKTTTVQQMYFPTHKIYTKKQMQCYIGSTKFNCI